MTSLLAALLLVRQTSDVTLDFTQPRGLIVAQAVGNGDRVLHLLIDTGAQRTVVDSTLAKELNLALGDEVHARGAAGTVDAHYAKGLRLAGLNESFDAVALPLATIGAALGTPIDVILGQDVLAKRVVAIDAVAGKLTLGTRPPVVTGADSVISLHERGGRPYLMATVITPDGQMADAEMLLDSGSDTTAELAQPFAEELGLRTVPDPNGRRILGLGGTVPVRLADVRELRVGNAVLPPDDVRVFSRPVGASADGDGRVGNGFLARFKATIDGPGRKLVLTPLRKGA